MNKVIREVIIALILVLIIVFAMAILFYGTTTEQEVSTINYSDENLDDVLEDISNTTGNTTIQEQETIVKTYSVKEEDLTNYTSQEEYTTGKKDPFAETIESSKNNATNETGNETTEGTFFEKSNSK